MQTTTTRTSRSRITRFAAVFALAVGFTGIGAGSAAALPPDGPGPETPGTSSRVWPTTVQAGDTLYFEVSGYPANEIVYIKIDDGEMCSDTSHGACVYHTQRLDGSGYASGSIVVPGSLAPGAHWLRMLATGDTFDERTGEKIGYEGYTRRGGNDFTVVAGGDPNAGGSASGGATIAAPGGGSITSEGDISGGSVTLDIADEDGEASTDGGQTMDDLTVNVAEDKDGSVAQNVPQNNGSGGENSDSGSGFPVLGASVLGGSVLLGGGALTWALTRKKATPEKSSQEQA